MANSTDELFERLTAQVIEAIETGNHGAWAKPWTTTLAASGITTNAVTRQPYQGFNALLGMVMTATSGYGTNLWATYKQWASVGAQVRKGEHGQTMVKWGTSYNCPAGHKGQRPCECPDVKRFLWAHPFTVFNADQVDGYTIEIPEPTIDPVEAVEAFIAELGADISERLSDRAFYTPATDRIVIPTIGQFDTLQGYYGTKLHELTHWTGHQSRCERNVENTFGTPDYAFEELVAELGAVFFGAHFGIEVEPHMEHTSYLAGWLGRLKDDPRALYRASKLAAEAVGWALGRVKKESEVAA